jgi:hypothetical protein
MPVSPGPCSSDTPFEGNASVRPSSNFFEPIWGKAATAGRTVSVRTKVSSMKIHRR